MTPHLSVGMNVLVRRYLPKDKKTFFKLVEIGKINYIHKYFSTDKNISYRFHEIVRTCEGFEKGECHCCGKLGPDYMCNDDGNCCMNEVQYIVDKCVDVDINTDMVLVKWYQCDENESTWEHFDDLYDDVGFDVLYDMFNRSDIDMDNIFFQFMENSIKRKEEKVKKLKEVVNVSNGFSYSDENHHKFIDKRLRDDRKHMRENLWSNEDTRTMNTHATYENLLCTVDGEWLPKHRFINRRLKKCNQNRRYNLHPR